ncbi:piggyBac transposable element-derived protein 4-like [Bacillus rossius redtenbacheri]|uniref:piggyBac transposable element-derived protein 4-like n=1 Tax=Bacillus rossius redtenbacheri TaxID=93214 RepID=UPI002FDD2DC7
MPRKHQRISTEEALELYFALPSDTDDSDRDPDEGAEEEFCLIENQESSFWTSDLQPGTSTEPSSVHIVDQVSDRLGRSITQCSTSRAPSNSCRENVESRNDDRDSSDTEVEQMDEDWSQDASQFDSLAVNMDVDGEVTPILTRTSTEKDFFMQIFSKKITEDIVEQTNLYATQVKMKRRSGSDISETTSNWDKTYVEEVQAWIGMNILMGLIILPQVDQYCSSDPALGQPTISQVMTCKRFKKITETIHINDNQTILPRDHPNNDKLHKVRPLITNLNNTIAEAYTASSVLAVDESMIPFKGRSSLKQYMPMKPVKRGYKVWCLADSRNGYVLKFEIYTGKSTNGRMADTLGERVVLSLTRDLKGKGCVVAFDNFFTTVNLMKALRKDNIYAIGTVRTNRKGLPAMLKEKVPLKRGEFQFQCKEGVAAIKWMDRKPVTILTTSNNPMCTTTVSRKNKDGTSCHVSCPTGIATYNEIMGGIDHFDQLRERYAIGRRSRKWWHRIMYYLIDLAIVNAFILWKISRREWASHDQLSFRLRLARQLIANFSNRKRKGRPVSFLSNKEMVPKEVRLTKVGDHMPILEKTYRRCRLCSTKVHDKRTRYICKTCNVPLCIEPCFRKFHGK